MVRVLAQGRYNTQEFCAEDADKHDWFLVHGAGGKVLETIAKESGGKFVMVGNTGEQKDGDN